MKINRHNYEELFLFYVDKELSAAERRAVEVFVQENPDLQAELSALQQTVLKADEMMLDKKDWLYMEDGISTMHENLLLYADDELSVADRKSVEALLATDKTAAAEWNILRQTKLQPDTSLVFDDKNFLYRTAGGRVIGFKWWKVAAAAVLLGFGLWTAVTVYNNNFNTATEKTGQAITKADRPTSGAAKNNLPGNTPEIKPRPDNKQQLQNVATIATPKNIKKQPVENPERASNLNGKDNNGNENNAAFENNREKPSNNLPKPYLENINRNERNENAVVNVTTAKGNINTSGTETVVTKANPVITNPAAAATPVVYATGDNNDNNRFLYMDEEKAKRTKFGGFIRKAKRVLERTANVKTGDGLKVAGFEIALK